LIDELTERVIAGKTAGQSVADLQRTITAGSLKSLNSDGCMPAPTPEAVERGIKDNIDAMYDRVEKERATASSRVDLGVVSPKFALRDPQRTYFTFMAMLQLRLVAYLRWPVSVAGAFADHVGPRFACGLPGLRPLSGSPLPLVFAVVTFITPVERNTKSNLRRFDGTDRFEAELAADPLFIGPTKRVPLLCGHRSGGSLPILP
jgi:hypothetical protein